MFNISRLSSCWGKKEEPKIFVRHHIKNLLSFALWQRQKKQIANREKEDRTCTKNDNKRTETVKYEQGDSDCRVLGSYS